MNVELSSALCFHRVVKALGLILASLLFTAAALGQGAWVRVGNTATTLIYTNDCNGTRGLIRFSGAYRFGLYVAPGLGQPSNALTLIMGMTNTLVPGTFGNTDPVSLGPPISPGNPFTFQVRGSSLSGNYSGASDIGYVTPSSIPEFAPYIFGNGPGQVGGFDLLCGGCCPIGAFANVLRLTNREVALNFVAPSGVNFRIDAATNLSASNTLRWNSLLTLQSAGINQHTDSAAPFLSTRFYRAEHLTGSNILTGDHLATTNGDVVFHPVGHASFVMRWNDKWIYNDPTNAPYGYEGFPKADLILISHRHGDHYSASSISSLRASNGIIIVPQDVYNQGDFASLRPYSQVLVYNASTNVIGVNVQAVAAYNANHQSGINNAYVTTIGGKRIFTTGDCGNGPEIRALTNIDVAFLAMNRQFTMNWLDATNVARTMRPLVVYPYHYREGNGDRTNAALFKQNLGQDLGIEVRLRKWY